MFVVKLQRACSHTPHTLLHIQFPSDVRVVFFLAVFPRVYFCFTNLNIARYILVGILSRAHKYAERNTFHNQMSTINVKEIVSSSVSSFIKSLFTYDACSLRSFTLKNKKYTLFVMQKIISTRNSRVIEKHSAKSQRTAKKTRPKEKQLRWATRFICVMQLEIISMELSQIKGKQWEPHSRAEERLLYQRGEEVEKNLNS